jgi:antitoxin ParD1/3/4
MNISLTPELDNYVKQKVQDGLYNSASEVVRESLRLLKKQDEFDRAKLEELRKAIQLGDNQINRGEYTEHDVSDMGSLVEKIIEGGRKRLQSGSNLSETLSK